MTIRLMKALVLSGMLGLAACGGGNGGVNSAVTVATESAPDHVTVTGKIDDGPVTGGTVYVFSASDIDAVLEDAMEAEDRSASLAASDSAASLVREESDGNTYTIDLGTYFAGRVVFVVFDNENAVDETFGDIPFNMESVRLIDESGGQHQVNITPHTTMVVDQVRASLDLAEASAEEIGAAIDMATEAVVSATASDEMSDEVIPAGTDIIATTDVELLEAASTVLGRMVRTAAAMAGITMREALTALAADAADSSIDGVVPASIDLGEVVAANAETVHRLAFKGRRELDLVSGSCATVADVLDRACQFNVVDDLLEGRAICQDTDDEAEFEDCFAGVIEERAENAEACEDMLEARLDLCESLDDAVHEPDFGEEFAENFVDPREIGGTVDPNPWFPLIAGNTWVYEGVFQDDEGEEVVETITVTVTGKVKLIEDIPCLVVNDVVEEDGEVIEDTDDWFAQDVEGNVWYCGEIAQEFETFEEDEPAEPELVELEGSWKAGRDRAEAGMLIPAAPEPGMIIRQEVLFGEAEDVIEILGLDGTESAPGGSCEGDCLVTRDFTPLEPDVEENKYYVSGLGMIVEVNLEDDERVELQSFMPGS